MSKIYNDMKKGYKINVGQDIGDRVRSLTFNNGWDDFDTDVVNDILDSVKKNYFILKTIQENDYSSNDIKALNELLTNKIYDSYEKFKNQEATPKQIYYYIHLCDAVGEETEQITNNMKIAKEIARLKRTKNEMNVNEVS